MSDYRENCVWCGFYADGDCWCTRWDIPCTPEEAEACARESGEAQHDGMREAGD